MGQKRKTAEEYHEKFSSIPKDYMERLKWLFQKYPFKKKHIDEIISKITQLEQTEWDSITYIFYMEPEVGRRPRLNPKTFTFYVPGAANNRQMFEAFKEKHSEMDTVISTPCIITAKAYAKTPATMSMEEKLAAELELIHNLNSPDWDNIAKIYCDMVQNVLISNDSIVCKGSVEKFYSCLPRVEVTVSYMLKYDCKYNKKTVERRKSFYENDRTVDGLDYII